MRILRCVGNYSFRMRRISSIDIVREIRGRAVESDKGAVGRVNNRCAHRYECTRRDVCKACCQRRSMQCKFCRQCNSHCPAFVEQRCDRLLRNITDRGQAIHAAKVKRKDVKDVSCRYQEIFSPRLVPSGGTDAVPSYCSGN